MARTKKKGSKKKSTRSRKKKNTISVDFEGVESGGGMPIQDGNYVGHITEIEQKEGESSGEPYLSCKWKITDGPRAGRTIYDNVSLQPQSLWRFRTLLECMGFEVEDGEMDIDESDLIEAPCGIEVTNEDYDGRDRPRITGFMPSDEVEVDEEEEEEYEEEEGDGEEEEEEGEEEEEEEPAPRSRKKKGKGSRSKKIRVGSKVKFTDEEGDTVKGVVTEMEDDTLWVEDSAGDVWEVDKGEVEAA